MFCAADMPHGWHEITSWEDAVSAATDVAARLDISYEDVLNNLKDLAVYSQMALTLYREEQDA
jgi:hypothetical protein